MRVVDGHREILVAHGNAQRTGADHLARAAREFLRGELVRAREVLHFHVVAAGNGVAGGGDREHVRHGRSGRTRREDILALERGERIVERGHRALQGREC